MCVCVCVCVCCVVFADATSRYLQTFPLGEFSVQQSNLAACTDELQPSPSPPPPEQTSEDQGLQLLPYQTVDVPCKEMPAFENKQPLSKRERKKVKSRLVKAALKASKVAAKTAAKGGNDAKASTKRRVRRRVAIVDNKPAPFEHTASGPRKSSRLQKKRDKQLATAAAKKRQPSRRKKAVVETVLLSESSGQES